MPTFVTFYGYAFEGAPTHPCRGWFAIPEVDHLVTTRARSALGRAVDTRVSIYRCHGMLDHDQVWCEDAEAMFDGDARDSLWWFTLYCARSVLSKWTAPELVREYLKTGSPSLRRVAHGSAWAASTELEGIPRLAARVAMYAAAEDQPVLSTREACRLAAQAQADRVDAAAAQQERALSSTLLSCTTRPPHRELETEPVTARVGGAFAPHRRGELEGSTQPVT